jgi:hypothetical protein
VVGTSQAKLDLEDFLDRYDTDPRELNASPFELRSEREIDCDALAVCAEWGDVCWAVAETAFVSFPRTGLLGWLQLSALEGSGKGGAVAAGGGEGRGVVSCECGSGKGSSGSDLLRPCETR